MTYGAADFVGGLVSRRAGALPVVVLSQLAGMLLLLGVLPLVADGAPTVDALAWGAASGVAGGLGVALLYRGLAIGRMSIVAPVTAVGAASLPVLVGLLLGERPAPLALLGVGVALAAVTLVSAAREEPVAERASAGLREAVGAGVAFGLFFVLLDRAGAEAGLWPLLGARLASVGLLGAVALARGRQLRHPLPRLGGMAAAGALDMGANVLYLLAVRQGLLSLVAVLTALYPVSTVMLARAVLGERLTRPQLGGLACAGVGVALIAAG